MTWPNDEKSGRKLEEMICQVYLMFREIDILID